MMRALVFLLITCLSWAAIAWAQENIWRENISRRAVEELATTLRATLLPALKEGGLTKAIAACNETAPQITEKLSLKKGWRIGRTSLNVCNNANAPMPGSGWYWKFSSVGKLPVKIPRPWNTVR